MEPDEIRAEIERRRKRAVDLKLRETLWALYDSYLKHYQQKAQQDPEMIYPDIRETLGFSSDQINFKLGETGYRLTCKVGPEQSDSDYWGSGRGRMYHTTKTNITLALAVDDKQVFEFNVTKTVEDGYDMPIFQEYMGKVTSFIEGPWETELSELLQKVTTHEKVIRDKRNAPRIQQQLREDMKRFGM